MTNGVQWFLSGFFCATIDTSSRLGMCVRGHMGRPCCGGTPAHLNRLILGCFGVAVPIALPCTRVSCRHTSRVSPWGTRFIV